ncbi:iron-sulfur cluster biosynthesis family protein [Paenibacillus marinisediminis]
MEIQMTDSAIEAIIVLRHDSGLIRLSYDTDGCGCAVNGVPSIWIIDQPSPFDEQVSSNAPFPVVIDHHHAIFFEEQLFLDAMGAGIFRLSSKQQIYSTHVSCVDKRVQF